MKFINKFIRTIEWGLVCMFGLMAILVFGNVVLRYGFNSGIVFAEEISRFLFMWLTLIGAMVVMKDHAHLGMSSVVSMFGERGQRVCRFAADSLSLACCLLLTDGAYKQVVIAMDDHAPVTGIPMGYVQLCLLISCVGICIVIGYSLFRQLSGKMPANELIPFSGSCGE